MVFLWTAVFLGFLVTLLLTPLAMEFLASSGIKGIDQQKKDKPELPTSGGIAVLFGFLVAVTSFIGFHAFLGGPSLSTELILASVSSVLTIALIGLIDDIHVKEEGTNVKEEVQLSVGFREWWVKPVFVIPAALPLMVVKAGHSAMYLPILGEIEWGILYPLVLAPIAVVAVSNATNMLAGQNGLEASMGAVALTSLGVFSYIQGSLEGAAVALGMAAPLLAFLKYNRYPSKVLPGDSLTYGVGAAFAAATIIANVERFAVFIFLPWIVEAFLKLRSRFEASSLGELRPDGTLRPKHGKTYSLTHLLMKADLTESQIVLAATLGETVLCIGAFIVFL
jgi:UDP-N-acetylglucosamine--dolichyl-phosphate N-acetylglucosaminephosphotransferase